MINWESGYNQSMCVIPIEMRKGLNIKHSIGLVVFGTMQKNIPCIAMI